MKTNRALANHKKFVLWEICGFFIIAAGGVFMHSQFADHPSLWLALISSVNESTFEHLKIMIFPALVFSVVELFFIHHLVNNFWLAKACSLLFMAVFTIIGHTGFVLITGDENFIVDIVLFLLLIGFGQYINYRLFIAQEYSSGWKYAGMTGILVLVVCMFLFTFLPPPIEFLFADPINGQYGIDFSLVS